MQLTCVLRIQKAAFCEESFVFTCLTYRAFGTGWSTNSIARKASQMSKVHASSHEYPHVEKIKNLHEQNFKGEASDKQLAIE